MKKQNIKARIEILGKRYLVEEFLQNGKTKNLFYEEGKPNDVIYKPRTDSINNCLSALTQIYLKRISPMDRVIGIDKNIVYALKDLGYLDKKTSEWVGEQPPNELDVFTVILYNRLSRRVREEEVKEEKKSEINSITTPPSINVNLIDSKTRVRRLFEAYLKIADEKRIKVLEDLVTGQMFIDYKEKLISDF